MGLSRWSKALGPHRPWLPKPTTLSNNPVQRRIATRGRPLAIRHATAVRRTEPAGTKGQLLLGVLALLMAVPVAFLIAGIHKSFPEQPGQAVQGVVGLFALFAALPSMAYFFR